MIRKLKLTNRGLQSRWTSILYCPARQQPRLTQISHFSVRKISHKSHGNGPGAEDRARSGRQFHNPNWTRLQRNSSSRSKLRCHCHPATFAVESIRCVGAATFSFCGLRTVWTLSNR
uniref:(northern house mosquito) hypothetical protein n=1 Tax=Culex pipiens TaxID=7175 RepID=A0A8D8FN56_CULPI